MNRNDKLINDEILSESIQSDVLKRNNKLIVLSKLLSNLNTGFIYRCCVIKHLFLKSG